MRRLTLLRAKDFSGVSGTGTVAEGIQFSSGVVALNWISGEHNSTSIWPSIDAVKAVHGHEGATTIVWED